MHIEPLEGPLRKYVELRCRELWGDSTIVTRGRIHVPCELPGFCAIEEEVPVGSVTFRIEDETCELTTLEVGTPWRGTGTALLVATESLLLGAGCQRLWLVTTNDNVDALRFYQRRGFRIAAIHTGAIEKSRKLKPGIPERGEYGIPIRDEIELEKALR